MTNGQAHHCENPDNELNVVDCVEADEDDAGNKVVFLLDVDDCLDTVPKTDRRQGDHRCQDVPILRIGEEKFSFFKNDPKRKCK